MPWEKDWVLQAITTVRAYTESYPKVLQSIEKGDLKGSSEELQKMQRFALQRDQEVQRLEQEMIQRLNRSSHSPEEVWSEFLTRLEEIDQNYLQLTSTLHIAYSEESRTRLQQHLRYWEETPVEEQVKDLKKKIEPLFGEEVDPELLRSVVEAHRSLLPLLKVYLKKRGVL